MIYVCSKYDFHASYVFCFCVQYYIIEQFHLNGKIIHNEMKANFDFFKDLANDSAICTVLQVAIQSNYIILLFLHFPFVTIGAVIVDCANFIIKKYVTK